MDDMKFSTSLSLKSYASKARKKVDGSWGSECRVSSRLKKYVGVYGGRGQKYWEYRHL
jgi:hypothetical protein